MQIKQQCAYEGCKNPPVIKTIDELNVQNNQDNQLYQIYCCKEHFIQHFEDTVHYTCQKYNLMPQNSNILIGVSGGKDSSSLLHCLYQLVYIRYRNLYADKNVKLYMCAVDEGIKGYRTPSLNVVYQLQKKYNLPLQIISFQEEYGRTLDTLISELEQPQQSCSYCGILRRNSLSLGAQNLMKQGLQNIRIATGHNADDQAETVLLNITRGDYQKLNYCTKSNLQINFDQDDQGIKIKPYTRISQRDIVMYAHYCQVPYFSTECPYAVTALRALPRAYIRKESRNNPFLCLNIIDTIDEQMEKTQNQNKQKIHKCQQCGNLITSDRCQVCLIKQAKTKEELKQVLKFKKTQQ